MISRNRAAATLFVDNFVRDGQTLGLGTGELSSLVVSELGARLASGRLQRVRGVASSPAAASEAAFHGLPLVALATDPQKSLNGMNAVVMCAAVRSGSVGFDFWC
jgi:ribose 5-phosphate isomerase